MTKGLNITRSPCIGICSTSSGFDTVCRGCHRTSDEILRWNVSMSEAEKAHIKKRLDARKIIVNNGVFPT